MKKSESLFALPGLSKVFPFESENVFKLVLDKHEKEYLSPSCYLSMFYIILFLLEIPRIERDNYVRTLSAYENEAGFSNNTDGVAGRGLLLSSDTIYCSRKFEEINSGTRNEK